MDLAATMLILNISIMRRMLMEEKFAISILFVFDQFPNLYDARCTLARCDVATFNALSDKLSSWISYKVCALSTAHPATKQYNPINGEVASHIRMTFNEKSIGTMRFAIVGTLGCDLLASRWKCFNPGLWLHWMQKCWINWNDRLESDVFTCFALQQQLHRGTATRRIGMQSVDGWV